MLRFDTLKWCAGRCCDVVTGGCEIVKVGAQAGRIANGFAELLVHPDMRDSAKAGAPARAHAVANAASVVSFIAYSLLIHSVLLTKDVYLH